MSARYRFSAGFGLVKGRPRQVATIELAGRPTVTLADAEVDELLETLRGVREPGYDAVIAAWYLRKRKESGR